MMGSDSKRATFEQYLDQNNINSEAFEEARQMLIDTIEIPDYFRIMVDSRVDLEEKPLTCCILHDETTPSFRYYDNTKKYHCFGCGRTGTIVELHYNYKKRDFPKYTLIQSVLDLANIFKVKIPNIKKDNSKLFAKIEKQNEMKKVSNYGNKEVTQKKVSVKGELPLKTIKMDVEKRLKQMRKKDINKYVEFAHRIDTLEVLSFNLREKYEEILTEIKGLGM